MFKWEMSPTYDRLTDALPALGRVMAFYMSAGMTQRKPVCVCLCVRACVCVSVCVLQLKWRRPFPWRWITTC